MGNFASLTEEGEDIEYTLLNTSELICKLFLYGFWDINKISQRSRSEQMVQEESSGSQAALDCIYHSVGKALLLWSFREIELHVVTSGPNLASVVLATGYHSSFVFGNSVKSWSTTESTKGFHYRLVSVFP